MRALSRWILGLAAGAVVFFMLAYPAVWGELYARRELFRAFEFVGIMDPEGALGGQILGFNFQREPRWAHWVAQGIGSVAAFAPAVVAGVVVMRGVSGAGRATLCGCCGGVVRGATGPACPRCGAGFEEIGRRREGAVAWWMVRRVAVAAVAFGAACTYVEHGHGLEVQSWVLGLGEGAGQVVRNISGFIMEGPDGPFMGEGAGTWVWNLAWRNAAWLAAAGAGFVAAMLVFGACSAGALGRSRVFGYRGRTRCGGCGYALAGLREMRCPECGRGV